MAAPQLRHYGVVKNGKVCLHNLFLYNKNIQQLEGKQIEFSIKEKVESPTLDQYAYYRGAIIETALTAECFGGWTADEVDEHFSDIHLGFTKEKKLKKKDGSEVNTIIRVIPSKSSIGRKKMAEFIDKCIMDLAQEGIVILTPEQYKLTKYQTIHINER